jgi:hypothetical protein
MNAFEGREHAFEKLFEIDQELHFKIMGQTIRLFATWVAKELGLPTTAVQSYVEVCLDLGLGRQGHEDVLAKCEKDFRAKGIPLTHHRLAKEMESFYQISRQNILK